jgi:hypothetical protein
MRTCMMRMAAAAYSLSTEVSLMRVNRELYTVRSISWYASRVSAGGGGQKWG